MKILHTADWHLGQTFYEYSRYDEHVRFLDWLRRQIKERKIDVLLVAGDIFDGPNPSAESQRLYYSFLRRVTAVLSVYLSGDSGESESANCHCGRQS